MYFQYNVNYILNDIVACTPIMTRNKIYTMKWILLISFEWGELFFFFFFFFFLNK